MSAELKMGLNSLPTPKNDYEIVVPEEGEDNVDMKVWINQVNVIFLGCHNEKKMKNVEHAVVI